MVLTIVAHAPMEMRLHLIILRLELPVQDIKVANNMFPAGCLGDDAGPVLHSPLDADLQPYTAVSCTEAHMVTKPNVCRTNSASVNQHWYAWDAIKFDRYMNHAAKQPNSTRHPNASRHHYSISCMAYSMVLRPYLSHIFVVLLGDILDYRVIHDQVWLVVLEHS